MGEVKSSKKIGGYKRNFIENVASSTRGHKIETSMWQEAGKKNPVYS